MIIPAWKALHKLQPTILLIKLVNFSTLLISFFCSCKYNPKILLKYLNDLADLDIGIKTGEKDKELTLELFILNL